MRGSTVRVIFLFAAAALCLAPVSSQAMDAASYRTLTSETIKELVSGDVKDVPATIARLEKAMELGIAGCKEHAAASPNDAKLMDLVVAQAPAMKAMKAEALEESWGDEGTAGDAISVPLKSIDQFSATRNYVDVVVHPARHRLHPRLQGDG